MPSVLGKRNIWLAIGLVGGARCSRDNSVRKDKECFRLVLTDAGT